ncbi:hypothetical protein DCAR_0522447 [Daucus carota subsp. sativus]|uniref:Uncharacterized protein n=1 Tax=Daucus carota subsp. sativus TaxID=79200 RepID=A0A164ZTM1_DAUCS|nr:hypothetical protein DCAR_0522447 [Daucus carota subsp. sativus]
MDSGELVMVIWVGVVFASIICTAAYFGGLGGATRRCFSSKPPNVDPDVEKGEIKITSDTGASRRS